MKVLIITPHLSTGGQPQYLLKKLETLKDIQFSVVEWTDITGGKYVVQRDRIKNLLQQNFYSLSSQKSDVLNIISLINPDVIHFEEIPETFINRDILNSIYDQNRTWKIVVTTHSSQTDFKTLTYLADKFILVSEWSLKKFKTEVQDIDAEVWEYPIQHIDFDKNSFKEKLNFNPKIKHVLNVGLFTPGKNQSELIELARLSQIKELPIQFHFVGNQAVNFSEYWRPLMHQLPGNCVIHGERNDVDDFYKAADLFYFPSNLELNPISVKEAQSFKLPIFLKQLPTYSESLMEQTNQITTDQHQNLTNICNVLGIKNK